jgi:hypothetical protein
MVKCVMVRGLRGGGWPKISAIGDNQCRLLIKAQVIGYIRSLNFLCSVSK